jgi:hypothetical protein
MAFDKGHEKLGGRQKGTGNKATESIKILLSTLLPEEELARLWKQKLYSKDPHVRARGFQARESLSVRQACATCGRRGDGAADQDRHQRDPDPSRESMNDRRVRLSTVRWTNYFSGSFGPALTVAETVTSATTRGLKSNNGASRNRKPMSRAPQPLCPILCPPSIKYRSTW